MKIHLSVAALCLAGCGGAKQHDARSAADEVESRASAAGEHFLVEPVGDAERLLGRAVKQEKSGKWVLADERAPGCSVRVRKTQSAWKRQFQEDIKNVGGVSASVPFFAKLQADYGDSLFVLLEIDNAYTLEADVEGKCGDDIVTSVKVGTGTRAFSTSYKAGFGAQGESAQGSVNAGWQRESGVKQAMSWSEPQGWAFTVGNRKAANVDRLQLTLETSGDVVKDCDRYALTVGADQDLHIIIAYRESDGTAGFVTPTQRAPHLEVPANVQKELVGMQVFLRDPNTAVDEKFVIYAFADEQEFRRLSPPLGHLTSDEVKDYMRGLEAELAEIPTRRWEKKTIGYRIEPQKPARTAESCE